MKAFIITYLVTGIIYYIASTFDVIKFVGSSEKEEDINDLNSFKENFHKAMGMSWKILSYIYFPVTLAGWFLFMLWMILSLPFKRRK